MVRNNCILFILCSIACFACDNRVTLCIKNVTEGHDSLAIKVKINGKLEVDERLKKNLVSLEYYEKAIDVYGDSVCVDVELPTLSLKERSCTTSIQSNLIIVTVGGITSRSFHDSLMKTFHLQQGSAILRAPEISIAFFKEKLHDVY